MSATGRLLANATFILVALLSLAVLGYVGLHSGRLFTSPFRTAFFGGVPLIGLVGALAMLRVNLETRLIAAICALAFGFSVYAYEAYLILRPAQSELAVNAPSGDQRNRAEMVRDLRAAGTPAYPAIFPNYLMQTVPTGELRSPIRIDGREVLPLSGIPNVASVMCNESGRHIVFQADEMGFNNPTGLWPKGRIDIAAIGDSFTQGYCVDTSQSFVGRIRARHPDTLSLGMSGAGPLVALANLKEYLTILKPRHVLWFFFEGNDLPGDLEIERRSPLLLRYLEPGFKQGLAAIESHIDVALRGHVDTLLAEVSADGGTNAGRLQSIISFLGLSQIRDLLRLPSTMPDQPNYALFRRILQEGRDAAATWGGCVTLVYLSGHPATDRPAFAAIHRQVDEIAASLGVKVIDAHAALRAQPDPTRLFPFGKPAHYNEEGHRIVAEAVLPGLGQPCPAR
jgi:lysophospholipase L1-like esterase